MRTRFARQGCGFVVALAGLSGLAWAGPAQQFSMHLAFNAQVLRFAPAEPESYSLFASADVTGFTDPNSADNRVRIMSHSGHFEGQTDPTGSGSTSAGFVTFNELRDGITSDTAWTVEVRDGATGLLYNYAFDLDGTALVADHMRPATVTSHTPGQTISSTPTFEWAIAPAMDPLLEYTSVGPFVFGPTQVSTPAIALGETMWTPDTPLTPGTYSFIVVYYGYDTTGTLLIPTSPTALNGAPELTGFSFSSIYSSYSQVPDLHVIPAPGAAVLAGVACVVGARRRRGC